MSRQIIFTPKAAKPPATYSQAVRAAGLLFVSGTAPHDPQTGALIGTTIQEQTRQCLRNIASILEAAGSSLDKIASVTVVLADEQDFQGMNEEYLKWFPSNPPARQGAKLPVKIPVSRFRLPRLPRPDSRWRVGFGGTDGAISGSLAAHGKGNSPRRLDVRPVGDADML